MKQPKPREPIPQPLDGGPAACPSTSPDSSSACQAQAITISAFFGSKMAMKMADIGNGIPHSKPNGSLPPLQTYVNEISAAADTITVYCAENALPHPAFDPEAPAVTIPPTAPLEVQAARQKIIASAARIQQVVTEPAEYLPNLAIHVRFDLLGFVLMSGRYFVLNIQMKERTMHFCKQCCTVLCSFPCPIQCLIAAYCKWYRDTQSLTLAIVSSTFMPSMAISLSNTVLDSPSRLRFLHRTRQNKGRARIPIDERCSYGYDQQLSI